MRRALLVLAVAFAVSLAVRAPNIGRPLTGHHEWCTAHSLSTAAIFAEEGAARFLGATVVTFDNPGDRGIHSLGPLRGAPGPDGRGYYLSYPPLAYLAAHAAFAASGVAPGVLAIEALGLALHAASALLVYVAVRRAAGGAAPSGPLDGALLAALVYLFQPGTLWFQSNVWTPEVFIQPLFIAQTAIAAEVLAAPRGAPARPRASALLALVTTLACLSEWLGFIAALAAFVLALARRDRRGLLAAAALTLAVAAALVLFLAQAEAVVGVERLLEFLRDRYRARSGAGGSAVSDHAYGFGTPASYARLALFYAGDLGPALLALAALLLERRRARGGGAALDPPGAHARLLCGLALAPVAVHHLVLFNFTVVHDFSTLKAAPALAFLLGTGADRLLRARAREGEEAARALARRAAIGVSLLSLAGIAVYHAHRTRPTAEDGFPRLGLAIRAAARPEEVVFVTTGFAPQTCYYARRNLVSVSDEADARRRLEERGGGAGLLVEVTPAGEVVTRRIRAGE